MPSPSKPNSPSICPTTRDDETKNFGCSRYSPRCHLFCEQQSLRPANSCPYLRRKSFEEASLSSSIISVRISDVSKLRTLSTSLREWQVYRSYLAPSAADDRDVSAAGCSEQVPSRLSLRAQCVWF